MPKIDQLESALILSVRKPDASKQAEALLDLAWHVAEVRTDFTDLPSKLMHHEQSLKTAIEEHAGWQITEINKLILEESVLPYANEHEAKHLTAHLERMDLAACESSLDILFTRLALTWKLALHVNQNAGRIIVDVDDSNPKSLQAFYVGAHTRISFQRTLRVPEDGREYPLPADMGTLPIYRIEDYAEKVPRHWLEDGGFFIPLYQREALYVSFGGAAWRPTAAKVAVGRINAITGKPYDERIREHEQDYVIIPDQKWLDGINTGKNCVSQFVAMPLGLGYTIEEQMTDEAIHGGFQIVVFEPKPGRFPDEDPKLVKARLRDTIIRKIRPRVVSIIVKLQEPHRTVGQHFLENSSLPDDFKLQRTESIIEILHSIRRLLQQEIKGLELAGWEDTDFESYLEMLTRPTVLGLPPRSDVSMEMGIGRGGAIKQQILRDHYGAATWDESAKQCLVIRIVNSDMFEEITGESPPKSPVTLRHYQASGIPWFDHYDETEQSVEAARRFVPVKSIAAIAKLRSESLTDQSMVISPNLIKRIQTPTCSERITSFLDRAETSLNAGRFEIGRHETTMALTLIERALNRYCLQSKLSQEKQRALRVRASCNIKLGNYYEAEADATDALAFSLNDTASLALRACSYLRMADYDLAKQDATKVIKLEPSCLLAQEVMCEALLWTRSPGRAHKAAEEALRLAPSSVSALMVRGECRRQMGYPLLAMADLNNAINNGGRSATAYAIRAQVFVDLGRVNEARSDLKAALELEPAYSFARDLFARISR